jgi:hypothetical protein
MRKDKYLFPFPIDLPAKFDRDCEKRQGTSSVVPEGVKNIGLQSILAFAIDFRAPSFSVILSERSESKDLRFVQLAERVGYQAQIRSTPFRKLP